MPTQVKNTTVYLAIDLKNNPEDRPLALKMLRQFGEGQAPDDYDFGKLADDIRDAGDWIIKHPESGLLTFITQEQYEKDFEPA